MTFADDNGNFIQYDGEFAITKQAASFFDFKIKGDVSIDFDLEDNSINRGILGYYSSGQVNSPAFSKNSFNLISDSGAILSRGYIVIKGDDGEKIKCFFISGNTNWFQVFAGHIKDIVFDSRYTVLYNAVDTQKAATEGIIFPLVDWAYNGQKRGNWFVNSNMTDYQKPKTDTIQEFFPCIYLHTVVEQMANYLGVKINGTLTNDPLYKRIIITPAGPSLTVPDSIIKNTICKSSLSATQNYAFAGLSDVKTIQFNTISDYNSPQFDPVNNRYMIYKKGTYKFQVGLFGSNIDILSAPPALVKNGATYAGAGGITTTSLAPICTNSSSSAFFWRSQGWAYWNLEEGDYVQVVMRNGVPPLNFDLYNTSYFFAEMAKETDAVYAPGWAATATLAVVPYIQPNCIIPDITCLELIKFLTVYFGAICTYEEYSKTLSLNLISQIKKETASNWSDFYVSHETNYQTGVCTNNYIQTKECDDTDITNYNQQSLLRYGGGNIPTSSTIEKFRTLYEIPFAPSWDQPSKTSLGAFIPFIKFYDLVDNLNTQWDFTTVTDNGGGYAQFNGAATMPFEVGDIVRIAGSGIYDGYGIVNSITVASFTCFGIVFTVTGAGSSNFVECNKSDSPNRILIALPGGTITEAGWPSGGYTFAYYSGTALVTGIDSTVSSTTACISWFEKPVMSLTIDKYHESLAITQIFNRQYNNTIDEVYLSPIKSFYNNPYIKAKLLLPESKFQSHDFSQYVYIKSEKLNGYFFVGPIVNYVNGDTPVEVNLYMYG